MNDDWRESLRTGRTVLLDGGSGSELRRRGVSLDAAAWSGLAALTHYELLRQIHSDYIASGADVITANSFATSRFVLAAAGHGEDFATINRRTVAAAREARDAAGRNVAIAGSLSCLPPRFDVHAYPNPSTESAAYREHADTLADEGVDLLILEMMQETRHAPLVLEAARATGLPVWLGVSCRQGAGGALVGFDFPLVPFTACLDALLPFAPDAVVVMHAPLTAIAPALDELQARWPGTLGAYAEIGDGAAAAQDSVSPTAFAAAANSWLDAGARIIGGCCGTTPAHIDAVARLLAKRNARRANGAPRV